MRAVRFPFVAIITAVILSGCVGADNSARLASGATAAIATAPIPVAPQPVEALEPAPDAVGIMPGDMLISPRREPSVTNPYAVLDRPVRVAPPRSGERALAQRAPRQPPSQGAAVGESTAGQSTTFAMAPPGTSRRATIDGQNLALRSKMIPLADVEAQAAIEQRAQESRDRRFDAQVRRASGSICDGCLTGPARRPARIDRNRTDPDE